MPGTGSQEAPGPGDFMGRCSALLLTLLLALPAGAADLFGSSRLLATGGVTSLEGTGGGGIVPWALIGGYGNRDQIGANAYYTRVQSGAYHLNAYGAMVGLFDRVELSLAQHRFDSEAVGGMLGLGRGFTFTETVAGAKVRLMGDAVLAQDTWLPQVALGVQYKHNNRGAVLRAIGARDDDGVDLYLAATKLFLADQILVNGTLRLTKANQLGILGFGGKSNGYKPQIEASVGYLLTRSLVIGAEYRMKPDNLAAVRESDWADLFVAWFPSKHVSLTAAYARLGTVAIRRNQNALYLSLQVGF
jgi:hypothetical protein